jgi:hypothetical protein
MRHPAHFFIPTVNLPPIKSLQVKDRGDVESGLLGHQGKYALPRLRSTPILGRVLLTVKPIVPPPPRTADGTHKRVISVLRKQSKNPSVFV